MIQAFFSVVYDLWCFVMGGFLRQSQAIQDGTNVTDSDRSLDAEVPLLSEELTLEGNDVFAPHLYEPMVMYVTVPSTALQRVPRLDFDVKISTLPYGTAVTAVSYEGGYVKVFKNEVEGWIKKDCLHPVKESVWPVLRNGVRYDGANAELRKLRLCIGDMFTAGEINLPLQAVEYIVFRLAHDHRYIQWPDVRPRDPGAWQWILRGSLGIHASVVPVTDSVMEWLANDGFGRLAYVEAVHPDQSIEISLVGLHQAGLYETIRLTSGEWRELRPVFIEVL